jgi:hypothetical protein
LAIQLLERGAEMWLEWRYTIPAADQRLRGIMKNLAQSLARGERPFGFAQGEHGEAVLGDAEGEIPFGVAAPAIGSGDPDRKILVRPCVGLRIEKIEPAARLQKDPGAGLLAGLRKSAVLAARESLFVLETIERLELGEIGKVHGAVLCRASCLRTSFQSLWSVGGARRSKGTPAPAASSWWRSA